MLKDSYEKSSLEWASQKILFCQHQKLFLHTTNVTAPVFRAGGIQRLPSTQSSADETDSPSTQNKIPLYFFILQTKLLETTGYSYLFDLTLNHSFLFYFTNQSKSNKICLRIYTQRCISIFSTISSEHSNYLPDGSQFTQISFLDYYWKK